MTETLTPEECKRIAGELMNQHLGASWVFRLDHAKRRAGACNYTDKEITVSRYFLKQATEEDLRQVLLHEIAHALAGHASGHGPAWKQTARALGYTGKRTLEKDFATDLAPWVGTCPEGHTVYRFRRPSRTASCSRCSRGFNARFVFEWRFIPPEHRGQRR